MIGSGCEGLELINSAMSYSDYIKLPKMISSYNREHGVDANQLLRCAANTGRVQDFYNVLQTALTENRPIPNYNDLGVQWYAQRAQDQILKVLPN